MPNDLYSHPARFCDVVMKGGITSGVVYPLAICELAKTYQFRNIGGASAGAIAAAAAAAAEYGRSRSGKSFAELESLPQWLGHSSPGNKFSNLFSLFQPQSATKPLFDILVAGIGSKPWKPFRVLLAAIGAFPEAVVAGCLPGLILLVLALPSAHGALLAACLVASALLAAIGVLALLLFLIVRGAIHSVPENHYGLCTGMSESEASQRPALAPWLADYLDALAGKTPEAGPLTFGDLWGGGDRHSERVINLEMMTTSLTHGRPYRLPWATNQFYYRPAEFRRLFPERIVQWMEQHPRAESDPGRFASLGLAPFPEAKDLPIVVAARLSLSFPLLLSAVPLYAIDYSRKVEEALRQPERCWFSDGGIGSNFPVHFFDSPLPRWPTFAINLRPFHPDYDTPVRMPMKNSDGILDWWTRFDEQPGAGKLIGFLEAILGAMQNWMDNTQTQLPGYRDRVVQVCLRPDEGGLNLAMPPEVIADLSQRGRLAGEELVRRFASPNPPSELTWDNHRWVRFRSTTAVLIELLKKFNLACRHPMSADRSYEQLIERAEGEEPASYPLRTAGEKEFAAQLAGDLNAMVESWSESEGSFVAKAPQPMPELRVRPRI